MSRPTPSSPPPPVLPVTSKPVRAFGPTFRRTIREEYIPFKVGGDILYKRVEHVLPRLVRLRDWESAGQVASVDHVRRLVLGGFVRGGKIGPKIFVIDLDDYLRWEAAALEAGDVWNRDDVCRLAAARELLSTAADEDDDDELGYQRITPADRPLVEKHKAEILAARSTKRAALEQLRREWAAQQPDLFPS